MNFFNQTVPWVLVCTALLSIAVGIDSSPGMMNVSLEHEAFETWSQNNPGTYRRTVDCPGDVNRDGVYRLVGALNEDKNQFVMYKNSVNLAQAEIELTMRSVIH